MALRTLRTPIWIPCIRVLGVLIAVAEIVSIIYPDRGLNRPSVWTIVLIPILPLLVPWRMIRSPLLWWPLFVLLCLGAARLFYDSLGSLLPGLPGTPGFHGISTLITVAGLSIYALHLPAVVRIRNRANPARNSL